MCEVEYMDTDAPWYWYYLADCGTWHRFEDDLDNPLSEHIEHYYLVNSKSSFNTSRSRINLSEMLQTDLTTGRQRRIKRCYDIEKSCSCFSSPPDFWEHFDPKVSPQLIPLSNHTPEYQTVANYIKVDGLLDRPIISIYRIQNVDLWELYCRKKKQLMRIQGPNHIFERQLFHGTVQENAKSICTYNFDLRLAGKHGNLLGKGIYFAKYASMADEYSIAFPWQFPDGRGQNGHTKQTKIMFLARVIVGESAVGKRHFVKPDPENINSCVDYIKNPQVFVIFDPNQIYPEYVIHYEIR